MKKLLAGAAVLLLIVYFWQEDTVLVDPNHIDSQSIVSAKKQKAKETKASTIYFTVAKTAKMLLLSGTFTDRKQSRLFARNLRPTYSTVRLKEDAELVDKGGIALASKILPLFKKHYIQGEIQYIDGGLVIKGTVPSQKILDQANALLKDADIPLRNLTHIGTKVPLSIPKKKHTAQKNKRATHTSKRKKHSVNPASTTQEAIAQKIVAEKKSTPKEKQQVSTLKPQKLTSMDKVTTKVTHQKLAKPKHQSPVRNRIKTLLKRHGIEFLAAKGALAAKGEETVDKLAKILSQYPHIHIEIAGHTDSDGSESFNQKLSQLRVDAVRKRLISKGISSKRLRAKGYGETKPLVPNTSDENKQKNRRVEINVLKILKI